MRNLGSSSTSEAANPASWGTRTRSGSEPSSRPPLDFGRHDTRRIDGVGDPPGTRTLSSRLGSAPSGYRENLPRPVDDRPCRADRATLHCSREPCRRCSLSSRVAQPLFRVSNPLELLLEIEIERPVDLVQVGAPADTDRLVFLHARSCIRMLWKRASAISKTLARRSVAIFSVLRSPQRRAGLALSPVVSR